MTMNKSTLRTMKWWGWILAWAVAVNAIPWGDEDPSVTFFAFVVFTAVFLVLPGSLVDWQPDPWDYDKDDDEEYENEEYLAEGDDLHWT